MPGKPCYYKALIRYDGDESHEDVCDKLMAELVLDGDDPEKVEVLDALPAHRVEVFSDTRFDGTVTPLPYRLLLRILAYLSHGKCADFYSEYPITMKEVGDELGKLPQCGDDPED